MLIDSSLGRLHWTRRCETLGESLALMRKEMMQSMWLSASVFVGGMEGITDEYELCVEVLLCDCRWPMCASWDSTRN